MSSPRRTLCKNLYQNDVNKQEYYAITKESVISNSIIVEIKHGKRKLSTITFKVAERLGEYYGKSLERYLNNWRNIVFIIALWAFGVMYVSRRMCLLVKYLFLNKKMFIEMDIDREKQRDKNESLAQGLIPNCLPILPRKKTNSEYVYLLRQDQRTKQIGSIVFAILPLIAFFYQLLTKSDLSVMVQYIAFPVFIQSFDAIFKSYEIDQDLFGMNMYHERILAKRRKGRPS